MKRIDNKKNEIREQRRFKEMEKNKMYDGYMFNQIKHEDELEPKFDYEEYNDRYVAVDKCKQGILTLTSVSNYKASQEHYDNVFNIARGDMGCVPRLFNLAPSKELFEYYRSNMNTEDWFGVYKRRYYEELKNNTSAQFDLTQIQELLDSGEDVCLLCFCRGFKQCHRKLIGKIFKNRGYKIIYK